MATVSDSDFPGAFPTASVAGELAGGPKNHLREALRILKREWIEAKMGKGQSWATKVFNNESGVMLDDIPNLVTVCGSRSCPATKPFSILVLPKPTKHLRGTRSRRGR